MTIFEKIIAREIPAYIVWEDKKYIAFLDIKPVNPGHTLLVPKKPIDNFLDMDDSEYTELFLAAKKFAAYLQKATSAKRIGIVVEGFGVPHVHIHLIPINAINELDHSRAHNASQIELEEMSQKIKNSL
jgi:histidine triad (HIT) family protein